MKTTTEKILHFFIVIFCCFLLTAMLSIPLELIFALFSWQPLAGRVLIYGIMVVLCFYKGYDNIEIEKIDEDDDKWQK
jgi:hypothetical protein